MRRRKPGNSDKKDKIVRAAFDVIAEKGFEGLRMREVARHAGLDNATLHYYFEGKEALIYGVLDYIAPDLSIGCFQAKSARAISARKLLSTHFRNLQRHRTEHPEVFIVLSEIETRSIRDPAIRTFMERIDEGWRTVLMSILETGIQTGEFRSDLDVNASTTLIMAALRGFRGSSDLSVRQTSASLDQMEQVLLAVKAK